MTIIANTRAATTKSQMATGLERSERRNEVMTARLAHFPG
jgi:hypothetical protein